MSFEIFAEEDRQRERELLATYDLDARFFNQLGLKIKQIVPERNCFRLETDKGFFCLKKMTVSYNEIKLMQKMAEHLKSKGFENIFALVKQQEEEILVSYEGSQYYLTHWLDGRESDYLNLLDIKESAEALARFHTAAEGFNAQYLGEHRKLYGRWKQGFEKKLLEIQGCKDMVLSDECADGHKELIISYLESCEKDALHAIELLDRSSYYALNARDVERKGFIHHDYNLHNILHTFENQTYIGSLEGCAFDIRMHDLAHFISRLMRRRGWDLDLALSIISYYDDIYKLEKKDYEALAIYFAFPHDFKQLYRQYYIAGKETEDLEEAEKISLASDYNVAKRGFLKCFEKYAEL